MKRKKTNHSMIRKKSYHTLKMHTLPKLPRNSKMMRANKTKKRIRKWSRNKT